MTRAARRFCAPAGHDTKVLGRYPGGNCAECSRIRSRQWHYDNPGRIWARNLAKYGITVDDYNGILAAQDGACRICGAAPKNKRLAVDHDHKTGEVRSLLCDRCNRVLGLTGEDVKLLGTLSLYAQGVRP